jgi:hydroxymethylpyrimidine/phosphomethylpyrimidine kinase
MNRQKTYPVVLSIAGSDSSGGAGIQADLKTFSALGVYGATAITAITAQNTQGVHSQLAIAPEMVYDQIISVVDDLHPT